MDAAVLTARVLNLLGLIGLWMGLWWQVKQQKGHRRYVEALARALPDAARSMTCTAVAGALV